MAKKKKAPARQKAQGSPKKQDPPAGRLAVHHPLYERILFILALAGVLVTVHLNIWYGAEEIVSDDPVCGAGFDCEAVLASDPALLGIPSAVSGLIFYLIIAGLCAGIAFLTDEKRVLLKKVRVALIGAGLAYSLYLTGYQFFSLSDRCLLCLLSASIVTLMAVVLGLYIFKPAPPSRGRRGALDLSREYQLYAVLAVLFLVLAGADYGYFASQDFPTVGSVESMAAAADAPVDVDQCRYDAQKPTYSNFNRLVSDDDPITGNPDALVTLVEYIDPNCPACKRTHPVIKAIGAKYPDQLRIVYKPVAIVGSPTFSRDEVAALYLAYEAGVFPGMLDLEFINQKRGGLPLDELTRFARQLGMDADPFEQALADGHFNERVRREKQIFDGLGLTGVPTLILEGRVIDSGSRSVGCLSYFIEQELQAKGLLEVPDATADADSTAAEQEGS